MGLHSRPRAAPSPLPFLRRMQERTLRRARARCRRAEAARERSALLLAWSRGLLRRLRGTRAREVAGRIGSNVRWMPRR